jgi:hypothetical protein
LPGVALLDDGLKSPFDALVSLVWDKVHTFLSVWWVKLEFIFGAVGARGVFLGDVLNEFNADPSRDCSVNENDNTVYKN